MIQTIVHAFYETLSLAELKVFSKWLSDKRAWAIFEKYISHCQHQTAEGTLGNPAVKALPDFLMAQGGWFVLDEQRDMPEDAAAVLKEKIAQAKEKDDGREED